MILRECQSIIYHQKMKLLIPPLLNQSYVEKNNTEIHMASVNASDTNQTSEGRDGISYVVCNQI
jgi:hypothetical protein